MYQDMLTTKWVEDERSVCIEAQQAPNEAILSDTQSSGGVGYGSSDPYTSGGKLRSRLQNEDDKLTKAMRMPRLRYIERPGRTVADSLVEKDPWYRLQGGCSRETCPICYWQKGKGIPCTRENVNYKIECVACEVEAENNDNNKAGDNNIVTNASKASLYLGETSRSARERVAEHLWLFKHRKQACGDACGKIHKHSSSNSALWVHSKEAHGGSLEVEDWRITITSSHRGALNRQVTEAVHISEEGVGNLLNSKMEFGANNISEVAIKKGHAVVGAAKRRRDEGGDGTSPPQ